MARWWRSVAFQSMWRIESPGWYSASCLKSVPAPRGGSALMPISASRLSLASQA